MSSVHTETIRQILDDWEMRFQDPTIQKTKGRNPKWVIRPVVPVLRGSAVVRRQKTITLGRCKEMTEKQAQKEKQRVMAEINGGAGLITAQIRVSTLIEKFREARLPLLAASTQAKYESHLQKHVAELSELELKDLTPDLLQKWLIGRNLGNHARADLKNLLSAMFEQARRWRLWTADNPLRDVEIPKLVAKREKRILNEDQVRRLREALDCCGSVADGVSGPDVRLMVDVVIATGWRISEVLGLKRDAISGEVLEIRRRWYRGDLAEVAKTAAGVRKNYVGSLAADLAAREGDFVFSGDGDVPPDDRNIMQHILRPCAEAVGCYWEGFGFHSFRRLNNTWRQEAGATPGEVMRALGHTKPSMTVLYTVADKEREKDVVEKIRGRVQ